MTAEERKAIHALKHIAKTWPKSLWLFAAGGSLYVMRTDESGNPVHRPFVGRSGGGVDPAYSTGYQIGIPCDGGDW